MLLWLFLSAEAYSAGTPRVIRPRRAPAPAALGAAPREPLLPDSGDGGSKTSWVYGNKPMRRAKPSVAEQQQAAADEASAAAEGDGYVFGLESIEACAAALKNGSMAILTEDGNEDSRGLLVVPPTLVGEAEISFLLEHTVRLQAALEPASYRAVYRSLHKIVLDNNNLAQPALSVSARGTGRSPRNAAHIAKTVRTLMQTDWAAAAADDTALAQHEQQSQPPQSSQPPSNPRSPFGGSKGGQGGGADGQPHTSSMGTLVCPGAVSLVCCREGGVLRRAGATEASVELQKLAGLPPVGLHARLPPMSLKELRDFASRWGIPLSSTADLVAYTRRRQMLVERCGPPARMPTKFGRFTAHTYRSRVDGTEHIALVKTGDEHGEASDAPLAPFAGSSHPVLVRVHSECCTGDVFGSLRCDCGPQLEKALEKIESDGWGVLLYLRGQEGRGIGLGAKMHAYALQERGVDTLDANLELGLPVDSREYGTGAQILTDLGITDMRLMSNNPKKFVGLTGYGLRIVERVPSLTVPNPENIAYLQTKIERMGHLLGDDTTVGTEALGFMEAAEALGAGAGGEVVPGAGVADVVLVAGSEGDIADSLGLGLEVPKVQEAVEAVEAVEEAAEQAPTGEDAPPQ